jgi:hypothetical protein
MSGTFGSHKNFRRGQKAIAAETLNDMLETIKALSNITTAPPLFFRKSKAGYVLGINRSVLGGELLLGRAMEDIRPRSFGRWQKESSGSGTDKGEEEWGEEEAEDIYNPWGITVPFHSRFQYSPSVGTNGPEIVMADIADEWTAEDIPIFRREDIETDPEEP